MRFVVSSPLLRNVLLVDAAFSGASGVALAAAAAPTAALTGLPYALVVGSLGLCAMLPRGLVWFVVAGNALWVVESMATLMQTTPTSAGIVAVVAQATVVAAIAAAQAVGLRQSAPAPTH